VHIRLYFLGLLQHGFHLLPRIGPGQFGPFAGAWEKNVGSVAEKEQL
jgi:hypothetical protein